MTGLQTVQRHASALLQYIWNARTFHAASQLPAMLNAMQFARAAMRANQEAMFLAGDSWGALGREVSYKC